MSQVVDQWLWWLLNANVSMVQTWFGIMVVAYFQVLVSLRRHFFLLSGHSSGGWILHHGVRKHTPSQTIRIKCAMSGCQLTRASLSDEPSWEGCRHFADEGEGTVKVSVIVIVSIFLLPYYWGFALSKAMCLGETQTNRSLFAYKLKACNKGRT